MAISKLRLVKIKSTRDAYLHMPLFFMFRWMQWNLDVVSAIIVLTAGVFAIANTDTDSGGAGLCISYALQVHL